MNLTKLWLAALLGLGVGTALAQAFPTKPIRLVMPYPRAAARTYLRGRSPTKCRKA